MKIKPDRKIKTVSDVRRILARVLSQIPGDMTVTKFNFVLSIQKNGFPKGD